ncbi:MAG: head-tail connector protein [Actinomycetia bacterium]|nr:head-tail connector protein [Actinomycetes bacterium]
MQPTPEIVIKRAEAAWADKSNWDDHIRELYRYGLPQRDRYEHETPGENRTDFVFDSTAPRGVKKFAGRVVSDMFPAGREWAQMEPGPGIPKENRQQAREDLQTNNELAFDILHNATNFNTAVGEWAMDLVTGTAGMLAQKGPNIDEPMVFQAVPILSLALDEGPSGSVAGVFRKPRVKHRNLKGEWPDAKIDDELKKATHDEPEKHIEGLWECTYLDLEENVWRYELYLKKGHKKLVERTMKSNPWIVVRLNKAAKEVNGRGPLMDVLADVKTINKLVELLLRNTALAVSGVYTGVDDGVLNPDTVRITPGSVISVSRNQGHPQGASLVPLERPGDINLGELQHERLSMSIKAALLDQGLPPMQGGIRSATEIIERMKELAQDIGAQFGRLVTEGMVPIMQRVIDILSEWGLMDMQGVKIGGAGVKLVVTGPLAQLQNLDEVERIVQTLQLAYSLVGREITMREIKVEEVVGRIAEKLGFPADLMRDEKEKKAIDQTMAAAAQQMATEDGTAAAAQQLQGIGQPEMAA